MSDYGYCPDCGEPGIKRFKLLGMTKCLKGHLAHDAEFNPSAPQRVREQLVESYFVQRVNTTGGTTRKVKWLGHDGAPDRLAGWPNGRHGVVELKRPRGLAEPHQLREHSKLRAIGLRVDILENKAEVDAYIAEMTG